MLTTKITLITTILAGIFLSACQVPVTEGKNSANTNAAANTATVNKVDPKVVEEVKEMLATHDKALNDQNLDAVMATFSTDPKVVVLGTGQGERFVGTEAIRNAYTEIFRDYDKGTLVTNCDWKSGDVDAGGKMAWLAATCQASDSMKGKKRDYVLNVTATVIKQDAGWKFISLHMSNNTSGGPPPDAKKDSGQPPDGKK
jgi:ketosteroid isomerase-like protein